jgi:hypothetical protein
MLYEMRTYTLRPGMVSEFESRFAERHPYREKYSKLGAFWHTEFGPLNQVIHVWLYDDLNQRQQAREAANNDPDLQRIQGGRDLVAAQEAEILTPAPFMRPMGEKQELGEIYEMRIYTYQIGAMPEVLKAWEEAIPYREEYSPLAACWYTELGGLNKFIHVWPYKDLTERDRIRAEARAGGHWPPRGPQGALLKQDVKILTPAEFSPMH